MPLLGPRNKLLGNKLGVRVLPTKEPVPAPIVRALGPCHLDPAVKLGYRPRLSVKDRLTILRERDEYRVWRSVSAARFCISCQQSIRGSKVVIQRDDQGIYQLQCPTAECKGTAREWVYPGTPLTSETVYQDWWRALSRENNTTSDAGFGANWKLHHA